MKPFIRLRMYGPAGSLYANQYAVPPQNCGLYLMAFVIIGIDRSKLLYEVKR